MIGGYQLVIKTRPASSSYGMLTGSVILGFGVNSYSFG